ncbi:helicase HerA-like domain-containing protein [Nonomuraea roseola]|uniref:Helicase HerA-like domain-containing protein n=1 Tax=Nonomuraea roseola TaxID=46179 RepID=A0ABV5Q0X0_9ACTN
MTQGYDFEGPALQLGVLMENGEPRPGAPVRVPLRMFNRHGLVAGATGTGKTKTLQVMAEQLSEQGVPVFLADIKGDLSGMASPGEPSEGLLERTAGIGQDWSGVACPVEFYALGGLGEGVPLRATMTAFGPTLLSKVLELNETQESSLGLIFHFADTNGLPLLDMKDLRAVIQYLIDNPDVLKGVGGLSKQTAGVILRALTNLSAEGADRFFGEPEFDTHDLLRVTPDGRGVVSILELPSVQDRPLLFSTFLMWLLADLFSDLPEVGDPDKPKLVFFFDEAHLLFTDASKPFLRSITQTVRLIRSKGIGVFFVTQTPKDVPADVLAQLGARVQHALRAFTPQDAKALKATVSTFPHSSYDLEELLTQLGIGEAVVTVLSDKGVPTPVAWTRLLAPRSLMAPSDPSVVGGIVAASPLRPRYGQEIDRQSAYELLAARVAPPPAAPEPVPSSPAPEPAPEQPSVLESVLGSSIFKSFARSAASSIGREISRSIFGTAKRRR